MKRLLLTLAIALPILAYVGEWMGAFAWSDSSIFRYIGKCVAEGGVMYQCAWDNKGPMLLLPNALGWRLMGVHGPGLVMMLMGLASVVLFHRIATLLAQERSAAWATALYSAVLVGNPAAVNFNSQEWAAVFFILIGVFSLLRGGRIAGPLVIGTCVGCVLLIKANLVSFGGAALVLWLSDAITRKSSWKEVLQCAAWSFVGFAGTLGLVTGVFAACGAAYDMWDATLLFGLFEYCKTDEPWFSWAMDYWGKWHKGEWVVLHYAALLVFAVCGVVALMRKRGGRMVLFLATWLIFDLFMTFGFKTFYNHYLVVSYPELCLLFACAVEAFAGRRFLQRTGISFAVASIAVFVAYGFVGWRSFRNWNRDIERIEAWMDANLPEGGLIAFGGGLYTPEIAVRTKARCPQKYFNAEMNYHFAGEKRRGEILAELSDVLSRDDVKYLVIHDVEKFVGWSGMGFVRDLPTTQVAGASFIRLR